MADFTIFVDYQNPRFKQEIEAGKNALLNFYINIEGQPFPGNPFLDFPVIVLGWWLEGYMQLVNNGEPVENTFMNGPFEFESALNGEEVFLSFRERTRAGKREARKPITITLAEYKSGLVQASQALVDSLSQFSAGSKDIDFLKNILNSVKDQR
jgi:hypothetical protein